MSLRVHLALLRHERGMTTVTDSLARLFWLNTGRQVGRRR